jgi:hypothetical protein
MHSTPLGIIRRTLTTRTIAATVALATLALLMACEKKISVSTYHYDNLRTGWNSHEAILKPSNVSASSLTVLSLQLDDDGDAVNGQPLIVTDVDIAGGRHDVAYLVTENDSVYAIDADTDTKLLKVSLGTPVPSPLGCGGAVGVDSTPAIDLESRTLYVMAYVDDPAHANQPEYYIHALDLSTLADKVPPRLVAASGTLSGAVNGSNSFPFQATYQRQRPGLLVANGNVYAGFGSFCDWGGPNSRGWVLGWQAGSLTPLPANELNNSQPTEPNNMFLSSVWESGYALAADPKGRVYFTTGNSDESGTTYDGVTNIQESVVKLKADLNRESKDFLFTPANESALDQGDVDLGAAGVMALPAQSGPVPELLVANGKDGSMFLLNREHMGGFTSNNAGALGGVQNVGIAAATGCWCGPTYFNDGTPHVVTSGGGFSIGWYSGNNENQLELWNLDASVPQLTKTATGAMPDTTQTPGFFTVVSSHDDKDAMIWAVSRPLASQPGNISLYAFNATPSGGSLPAVFPGAVAGTWSGGNANIVPVVANGKVYVASYKELDIFGLGLPNGQKAAERKSAAVTPKPRLYKGPGEHSVSGLVTKIDGKRLTIETRDHKIVQVDTARAQAGFRYAEPYTGGGVTISGSPDAKGVFQAESLFRTQSSAVEWPVDR